MQGEKLVSIRNLKKYFSDGQGFGGSSIKAVDGINLDIFKGEALGLVGESGCGKSTLGRLALSLIEATSGEVLFEGKDIYKLSASALNRQRSEMQIIFQDPYACLNPRMKIGDIIAEPLKFHQHLSLKERRRKTLEMMEAVGIIPDIANRYPHELSGGQQQRVGIARALILRPKFIVCDEPVSALDVSVQAQILNLLMDLKEEYHLTYLFISHNLSVVHHICDRIAVMYLGKIVEIADKETLFSNPLHPYTKSLLSAIPKIEDENNDNRIILSGDLPSPANPPSGCRFHTRCPFAKDECRNTDPELIEAEPGHFAACPFCSQI